MKIKELLRDGVGYVDQGALHLLDIELVMAFVLGVEKEYLIMNSEEEVGPELEKLFYCYLDRVNRGEPTAYITQNKEFFGINFYVDKRVLIPRPETELLVARATEYLEAKFDGRRRLTVLDVGTGSGNISTAIARHFLDLGMDILDSVTALELDSDALDVARLNVEQNGVDHVVDVFQSDLLEIIPEGERFDVIVANLPYIGLSRNRHVSDSAEKYKPNIALFGGEGGLELYNKMFQQMFENDIFAGLILGEFAFGQSSEVADLLCIYFDHYWSIEKDLAGIDRLFLITP